MNNNTEMNSVNNGANDQLAQTNNVNQSVVQQSAEIQNSNIINNPNINNGINQNTINNQSNINVDDEELIRAYVGKNYENIKNGKFNIGAFFFSNFYMFYRKMFGYGFLIGVVAIILSVLIKNVFIYIVIGLALAFLINKMYLNIVKKRVNKIKNNYSNKSYEELLQVCKSKGGTSVGNIFLGLLALFGVGIVIGLITLVVTLGSVFKDVFTNLDLSNIDLSKFTENMTINDINIDDISNITNALDINQTIFDFNQTDQNNETDQNETSNEVTGSNVLKSVKYQSHTCALNNCSVRIADANGFSYEYAIGTSDPKYVAYFDQYFDYINVDLYYDVINGIKTIVDFKIYLKSNGTDISYAKDSETLRKAIGLYSEGSHTETLTLKSIGNLGSGSDANGEFTFRIYTFTNSAGTDFEMEYVLPNGVDPNLTVGNKYKLSFDVEKDSFGYDITINSIN